jgi:hypothetical protein
MKWTRKNQLIFEHWQQLLSADKQFFIIVSVINDRNVPSQILMLYCKSGIFTHSIIVAVFLLATNLQQCTEELPRMAQMPNEKLIKSFKGSIHKEKFRGYFMSMN